MSKPKAKNSKRSQLRNAAAPRLPRATVVRAPRPPPRPEPVEPDPTKKEGAGHGWQTAKAFVGAGLSTVLGALLVGQNWLPAPVLTGALTGIGALIAMEAPEKWRSLGLGAMSAAGGQLGLLLIDDQLIKNADAAAKPAPQTTPTRPTPTTPPGKRSASDIPADALARAYERARLRMALTSDAN
jgi:hypothetical protein